MVNEAVSGNDECKKEINRTGGPDRNSFVRYPFSAATIRIKKKCPSSCNRMQNDFNIDKELEKKAKNAARRERMREDGSDGEVIE